MSWALSPLWAVAVLFLTSGCRKPQPGLDHVVEHAVESAVRSNGATIQLSSLTAFSWDKVFIFHPYMTAEAIDKALGWEWHSALKQELEYSDAFELLVFVRGSEVITFAKIPRKVGDWAVGERNGLRPGEDVFEIDRPPGSTETVMRLRRTN